MSVIRKWMMTLQETGAIWKKMHLCSFITKKTMHYLNSAQILDKSYQNNFKMTFPRKIYMN
jgi:hypothetical protein